MYGKFSEKAERVITLSQDEAKRFDHNYIGTEHLLLGLIREGKGIAAKALNNLNVDLESARKEVKETESIVISSRKLVSGKFGYTVGAKTAIELAIEGAIQMDQEYVGTEHILIGLIFEGEEKVAANILNEMGIGPEKIREEVLKILNNRGANESENQFQGSNGKNCSHGNCANTESSALEKYGTDLSKLANEGKLDPIIGREKELKRIAQILSRRTKNNPCIIGEPGVGKTAIAEGLAQKIQEGKVTEILADKKVVNLEISAVVAGTKYRGEFEERLKSLVDEVTQKENIILFIDEIHTVIGAGSTEGAIDASNILKPALAKGELQCIGATTLDEYRKHIEKDTALERRFQPVKVDEPTKEDAVEILKGLSDRYEAHHKVKITDEAIENAVRLSHRYVCDRYLPDKAIDLMDEAASSVRLKASKDSKVGNETKDLTDKLKKVRQEKEEAVKNEDFERAAKIHNEEENLQEKLRQVSQKDQVTEEVTEEDIAKIVSDWTGVPVEKITQAESEKLLEMENVLHQRIIGQEEAVKAVSNAIRRARAGLKDPKRPIGSFIFLGPTGVGKSELAKALAEVLFDGEDAVIRLDMSEYMERHDTSKLVGSPPGYVGHEEGGQLTEQVRRRPYSVLLLDEIEKAHPEVFNTLLQVLEDGRLTDSKGKVVDFKNTVIIMTSNAGADVIKNDCKVGFKTQSENEDYQDMKHNVIDKLKDTFRPEFINRIDEMIVFHSLERSHLKEIVNLMLEDLYKRMEDFNTKFEVTEAAKLLLAEEGYDPTYGARPLRRVIQRRIENELSEKILSEDFTQGDKIVADINQEKELVFFKKEMAAQEVKMS